MLIDTDISWKYCVLLLTDISFHGKFFVEEIKGYDEKTNKYFVKWMGYK